MGLSKKKLSPLQIQTLGDAHFATPEEVTAAGLLGNKGIRLGYYKAPEDHGDGWGQIIRYSGDAHLITVAPTGSGKGRDVLVGALLEYEGSCIVIDPKGQLAAITGAQRARMGQKIIVLNPLPKELPMDLGPSAKYNPMAYLDPNSDAFGPSCEAIADSIVMMHEDDPNSHFTDSARQLIAGIIMHLAAHGRDGEKNLVMMQRIVAGPIKVLEAFVAEALSSDKDGFISGTLARFASVSGEDRELRSIISTATTQCGFINNKAIGASLSASDFSFRDLKREATTVYLVLPAKFIRTCGKWFRLVLASAIAELWRDERGKYPILAIIDEFNQLGRLAVVADAMGMARGFGLQLWPILQDLPQLKGTYGDQWETFLGGAAVRQFFAPRETLTAEYVSKLCGVKTVVTQGQSVQHAEQVLQNDRTGVSWGQQSQPLLHPHNVSSLGPQESLILGLRNTVIDAFRKPYSNTPELEGLYSPDPYHKTDTTAQNPAAGSASFPPPTDSFAAREAAAAQGIKRALAHKRALPLRLLTWGSSANPILNVLRKVEYVLTLPLRLLGALLAAPFAIHNRPLGAVLGFLALFGFWEVWDGFAKQPFLTVYGTEQEVCSNNAWGQDEQVHSFGCKVPALKYTLAFLWKNAILAAWKHGLKQAAADFDVALTTERNRLWSSAGAVANRISYGRASGPEPRKPPVSKAKLSHVVVVDRAEGLPMIEIDDYASILNLEEGKPLPIFPTRRIGMGTKTLKKDVELQAVLRGDGTPVRCEVEKERGVDDDRAYCVFIPTAGLYGLVLRTDFESATRDKIAGADGRPAVRQESLWTQVPADEKLGEIYVVKENQALAFHELKNPEDKAIIMRGNARAGMDPPIGPGEGVDVRLTFTNLKALDEMRCVLGNDGKPVTATYVFQPVTARNEQPKPPIAESNPYYLVRVYDGRLGLVNKINYTYDTKPR